MAPKTILFLLFLLAAAIGSWYLARGGGESQQSSMIPEPVHHGYYLKQARILGTGANGNLLYEIEAERAEQMDDERIDFTDVRVRYSPDSNVPWVVSADTATLRENSPRITLQGHVIALSPGAVPDEETEIRTQYLELDPERYIAETTERVQIRVGERSLTATGMLASLDEQTVELKANVRGVIAP